MIPDILRPYLSRFVGAWAFPLAAWLGKTLGLDISEEMVNTAVTLGVGLTIYFTTHRTTDGKLKVNPGDAASATIAVVEKQERAAIEAAKP